MAEDRVPARQADIGIVVLAAAKRGVEASHLAQAGDVIENCRVHCHGVAHQYCARRVARNRSKMRPRIPAPCDIDPIVGPVYEASLGMLLKQSGVVRDGSGSEDIVSIEECDTVGLDGCQPSVTRRRKAGVFLSN